MLTLMLGLECLKIFWNAYKQGLFWKWMLSLQAFSLFAQIMLSGLFVLRIIPSVGMFQSQRGNIIVPTWEWTIPNVGTPIRSVPWKPNVNNWRNKTPTCRCKSGGKQCLISFSGYLASIQRKIVFLKLSLLPGWKTNVRWHTSFTLHSENRTMNYGLRLKIVS